MLKINCKYLLTSISFTTFKCKKYWQVSFLRSLGLVGAFISLSVNASAQASQPAWTSSLTDCAMFFGLLSKGSSEKTEQFKSLEFIYSAYAVEVYPFELDARLTASNKRIVTLIQHAKDYDDKKLVDDQTTLCFDALRKAEDELWPKLSSPLQDLIPKIFHE